MRCYDIMSSYEVAVQHITMRIVLLLCAAFVLGVATGETNHYSNNVLSHCYKDQKKYCMYFGAHLASVHNPGEDDLLFRMASNQGRVWIGGSDAVENQLVKLHYEDCEATSNGVHVATRRPSIPRHENTFGFLMALLNSYHHENWYTEPIKAKLGVQPNMTQEAMPGLLLTLTGERKTKDGPLPVMETLGGMRSSGRPTHHNEDRSSSLCCLRSEGCNRANQGKDGRAADHDSRGEARTVVDPGG
ncbi:ladderlectin-like [Scomber scombrus]|uniref:Ladderlectin-like n=1 Tax=Scomber scombrus TaxID=13677 RepID=A0AAV1Q3C3_SCOSC